MAPKAKEDVDKILCTSPAQLAAHVQDMRTLFLQPESEHNWEKFAKALTKLAALVRGGAYKMDNFLLSIGPSSSGGLADKIVACMLTERAALSKVALELLSSLAPRLNDRFSSLLQRLYIPPLLELMRRTNNIVRERAETCLFKIIETIHQPLLLQFITVCVRDSSVKLRRAVATALTIAVEGWAAGNKVAEVENVVRVLATDKDVEVRKAAKDLWIAYCNTWPERVDAFAAPLTPTIRRRLDIKGDSKLGSLPLAPVRVTTKAKPKSLALPGSHALGASSIAHHLSLAESSKTHPRSGHLSQPLGAPSRSADGHPSACPFPPTSVHHPSRSEAVQEPIPGASRPVPASYFSSGSSVHAHRTLKTTTTTRVDHHEPAHSAPTHASSFPPPPPPSRTVSASAALRSQPLLSSTSYPHLPPTQTRAVSSSTTASSSLWAGPARGTRNGSDFVPAPVLARTASVMAASSHMGPPSRMGPPVRGGVVRSKKEGERLEELHQRSSSRDGAAPSGSSSSETALTFRSVSAPGEQPVVTLRVGDYFTQDESSTPVSSPAQSISVHSMQHLDLTPSPQIHDLLEHSVGDSVPSAEPMLSCEQILSQTPPRAALIALPPSPPLPAHQLVETSALPVSEAPLTSFDLIDLIDFDSSDPSTPTRPDTAKPSIFDDLCEVSPSALLMLPPPPLPLAVAEPALSKASCAEESSGSEDVPSGPVLAKDVKLPASSEAVVPLMDSPKPVAPPASFEDSPPVVSAAPLVTVEGTVSPQPAVAFEEVVLFSTTDTPAVPVMAAAKAAVLLAPAPAAGPRAATKAATTASSVTSSASSAAFRPVSRLNKSTELPSVASLRPPPATAPAAAPKLKGSTPSAVGAMRKPPIPTKAPLSNKVPLSSKALTAAPSAKIPAKASLPSKPPLNAPLLTKAAPLPLKAAPLPAAAPAVINRSAVAREATLQKKAAAAAAAAAHVPISAPARKERTRNKPALPSFKPIKRSTVAASGASSTDVKRSAASAASAAGFASMTVAPSTTSSVAPSVAPENDDEVTTSTICPTSTPTVVTATILAMDLPPAIPPPLSPSGSVSTSASIHLSSPPPTAASSDIPVPFPSTSCSATADAPPAPASPSSLALALAVIGKHERAPSGGGSASDVDSDATAPFAGSTSSASDTESGEDDEGTRVEWGPIVKKPTTTIVSAAKQGGKKCFGEERDINVEGK